MPKLSPKPKHTPTKRAPPRSSAQPAPGRRSAQRLTQPPEGRSEQGSSSGVKASSANRREEVLTNALALIAEHGIAGASLRKLADKLGMSQPSLYHYFSSKEALIAEIVQYCVHEMVRVSSVPAPPRSREDLPRFLKEAVLALYADETHPRFVRFLFVVAVESETNRATIQRAFEEQLYPTSNLLAELFARDRNEKYELYQLIRMVVYAIGFPLLEQRALFRAPEANSDVLQYAEWVKSAAEKLLAWNPRS